mgnify:CR=1 FL=1
MKIYTRGGDNARTSLFTGERVSKEEARIEALGSLDELVAALGLAKVAEAAPATLRAELEGLQTALYLVMADIAGEPGGAGRLPTDAVADMEALIDRLDADLPPLRDFVIPGMSPASAALHLARTVCRRAERRVASVAGVHALPASVAAYLNRMSDLLFTMARWVDRAQGADERTFKERL